MLNLMLSAFALQELKEQYRMVGTDSLNHACTSVIPADAWWFLQH